MYKVETHRNDADNNTNTILRTVYLLLNF